MSRRRVVAAAFLLWAGTASAQEAPQEEYEDHLGLNLRGVRVTGSLATEIWHDDNILLSRRDEQDDFITVLVPELHLSFGEETASFAIDYRGRNRMYNDHSEFDGMEHYLDTDVRVQSGAFSVHAWDGYQGRNDAFNMLDASTLEVVSKRLDWMQNDVGATLAYDFGPVDAEATVAVRRLEVYDRLFDAFDHRRWEASLLAAVEALPKAQLFLEYGVGHTEYDNESVIDDFALFWGAAGVRGTLGETFDVTAKAGYFRQNTDQTSGLIESASETSVLFAAAAVWRASENGTLRFDLQRRPVESIYTGWMLVQRAEANYTHRLGERFTVSFGAFYEKDAESKGGEDRDAFGLSAGAAYPASRHLAFSLWAELRRKDSDDHTFEYENTRGFFGITVDW